MCIFRYPGGKSKARRWILAHKPEGILEYREPFVGGGGIFFGLERPEKVWLNDINADLMAVYFALRDRPAEFIARCRSIEPARDGEEVTEPGPRGGIGINVRLKKAFEEAQTDSDPAFRYFFTNRTTFGGRINYDIPSRQRLTNPDGWNITQTPALENAATRLAGVRLTCGDYEQLLTEPGEKVWVYADPPYVVNGNLNPSSQLYQHSFTVEDHQRFADAVVASPHQVAVSYDDDEDGFIRSLFPTSKGFHIVQGSWSYCGTTDEKKRQGKELLIMNYAPPTATTFVDVGPVAEQDDLTEGETDDLNSLETTIDTFRQAYINAGKALMEIRDRRLYRADYPTFEAYCRDRWGFQRHYANRLIQAPVVVDAVERLVPMGTKLPVCERQVRELARLEEPEQQAIAWRAAVGEAGDKRPTAALVKRHVDAFLPPKEAPEIPDLQTRLERFWATIPKEERAAALGILNSLASVEV